MAVIALQGIRGGTGTTSVTAALAWGLAQLNEKVLVIDFSPENLLRLHFGMPFAQARGWRYAHNTGEPWQNSALRYHSHLDFLPYGHATTGDASQPDFDWQKAITQLKNTGVYDWILIDSPAADPLTAQKNCRQYGSASPRRYPVTHPFTSVCAASQRALSAQSVHSFQSVTAGYFAVMAGNFTRFDSGDFTPRRSHGGVTGGETTGRGME